MSITAGKDWLLMIDDEPLTILDRRYMAHDEPVLKEPNNKPYYRQFEKPLRGRKQCNK